jgi:propanediol dehydratase small subunit
VRAAMLAELSDLFSLEALEADRHGDSSEAERLWDIADEIHERYKKVEHTEDGWRR